jgi:hypothetical protein
MQPTIYNLTLTLAATEYSYAIPAGTRKILFKERSGGSIIQYCFVSGESNTNYLTLPPSTSKYLEAADIGGKTLYVRCQADAGKVLEIETWA